MQQAKAKPKSKRRSEINGGKPENERQGEGKEEKEKIGVRSD